MKRLIFILAVVCTVFIGFGSVGYAYSSKDEVTQSDINNMVSYLEGISSSSDNIVVYYKGGYLVGNVFNCSTSYSSGSIKLTNCTKKYSTSDGMTISLSGTGSNANSFAPSDIFYSTSDFYDDNGNVVFPLPPEVTPTPVPVEAPEGIAAVQIIPQAITANLTILIPLGLVVLAILLGVRLLPRLVALFLR